MKFIKQPYYIFVIILFCLFMLLPIKSQAATLETTLISGESFNKALKELVPESPAGTNSTIPDYTITNIKWSGDVFVSNTTLHASGEPIYARLNNTEIEIYTAADKVYFNSESNGMFCEMEHLINIDFLNSNKIDTSHITSTSWMFGGDRKLEHINFDYFDTSNITNMCDMFYRCESITALDVSKFNTSNVTNMYGMFEHCSALATLDLSQFNTSNVTNMSHMFDTCAKLINLELGNQFNTSHVANMSYMFNYCKALTNLNLGYNFDTSNVTNMYAMFKNCSSLTSLDVSGFNTSNATTMYEMFSGCSSLTSLDVSGFNTTNVTNMSYIFSDCAKLTSLDVSGFNTTNVTYMSCMFLHDEKLQTIDVSNFSTPNVTNMSNMFDYCLSLTRLDISNFDLSNTTNMYCFVNGCESLAYLKMPVSLQYSSIYLPTKNGTTWTIEDGTVVTKCLVDGRAHTYKRSDYIEPIMSGSNPNQMSIPVTMDVDGYYEVSVPALLTFMSLSDFNDSLPQENRVEFFDDVAQTQWDNNNTYFTHAQIQIDGSSSRPLFITCISPEMRNDSGDSADVLMWAGLDGIQLDISGNIITISSAVHADHARTYIITFEPKPNEGAYVSRRLNFPREYNTYPDNINSEIVSTGYPVFLATNLNSTGTYTGNMTIKFGFYDE